MSDWTWFRMGENVIFAIRDIALKIINSSFPPDEWFHAFTLMALYWTFLKVPVFSDHFTNPTCWILSNSLQRWTWSHTYSYPTACYLLYYFWENNNILRFYIWSRRVRAPVYRTVWNFWNKLREELLFNGYHLTMAFNETRSGLFGGKMELVFFKKISEICHFILLN